MDWKHLFNPNRIGVDYVKEIDLDTTRSSFVKDYDRILFSAPFRKLQNKTQVFPLTDNIFVHNRLTHSLETASVGRTLGRNVGQLIADKYHLEDKVFQHFYRNELQHVVSAACLSHDIGNPPFGHAGEVAISEYFRNLTGDLKSRIKDEVSDLQWAELCHFEGNANGFRILTHNFNNATGGEFKLTFSTLAAMVKYPCLADVGNDKSTGLISTKKYNSFESEWHYWKQLSNGLNTPETSISNVYARHPFVYLVEAADDICYLIIDLEDAHRLKIISHEETVDHLIGLLNAFAENDAEKEASYQKALDKIDAPEQKVAYLRALLIHAAINECVKTFMKYEKELLAGNLQEPLTNLFHQDLNDKWRALQSFSFKNIYSHSIVMEREMAGYKILQGLLEEFVEGLFLTNSMRSKQLASLIPYAYQNRQVPENLYLNIRSILDFISAMTDQEAIDLFRLLKGIQV